MYVNKSAFPFSFPLAQRTECTETTIVDTTPISEASQNNKWKNKWLKHIQNTTKIIAFE